MKLVVDNSSISTLIKFSASYIEILVLLLAQKNLALWPIHHSMTICDK